MADYEVFFIGEFAQNLVLLALGPKHLGELQLHGRGIYFLLLELGDARGSGRRKLSALLIGVGEGISAFLNSESHFNKLINSRQVNSRLMLLHKA